MRGTPSGGPEPVGGGADRGGGRGGRDGGDAAGASGERGAGSAVRVSAYIMLFVLGLVEGILGTFHYSNGPGVLVAICFAVAILITCVLGARGMRSGAGGVLPSAGWFAATILLSTTSSGGSVIITNTADGKWFLFGGAVCAAGGAVIGFAQWSLISAARRTRQSTTRQSTTRPPGDRWPR